MKIRNSFISNSSSSSFILPFATDKDVVISFCKEELKKDFENRIEYLKKHKNKCYSNWEEVIERYQEDILNLDKTIQISTIKEYINDEWDLSEYYDISNFCIDKDLILYDIDDNILNAITEKINDKFKVLAYCEHM